MKIAIVMFGTSGRGGMETVTASLSKGFEAAGHRCEIFLLGGSADMAWLEGLASNVIGRPHENQKLRYARYVTQFPLRLARFSPDVVLAADPRATYFCAKIVRVLRMRTRVASWPHFTLSRLGDSAHLKQADFHLAISSLIAQEIEALMGSAKGIYTVYNPVDLKAELLPRPVVPTFLSIGRLQVGAQKRTDDLLGAAARLRGEFRVRIVGDGADKEALHSQADALGVSHRVEWLGWQSAPWTAAKEASSLVLTSAYEGFPMVLVESLARGVPLLSTDCPAGPADIVIPDENGWLYPVGDVAALAARMQSIIDAPSILPRIETVLDSAQRFSLPRTVDRIMGAIDAEMGKPLPPSA